MSNYVAKFITKPTNCKRECLYTYYKNYFRKFVQQNLKTIFFAENIFSHFFFQNILGNLFHNLTAFFRKIKRTKALKKKKKEKKKKL